MPPSVVRAPARALRRRSRTVDYLLEWWKFERRMLRTRPVIIYSMGKVGTTSITMGLRHGSGIPVVKVHSLTREGTRRRVIDERAMDPLARPRGYWHYDFVRRDLRVRRGLRHLISGVRDPIARSVSGYFHQLGLRSSSPVDIDPGVHGPAIERMILDDSAADDWFDVEMKRVTELDVFAEDFDRGRSCQVVANDRYRLLVLRQEDLRTVGSEVITSFLGLDAPLTIPSANEAHENPTAAAYARFTDEWRFSAGVLDAAYATRQAQHFYTAEELDVFRARWSIGRTSTVDRT